MKKYDNIKIPYNIDEITNEAIKKGDLYKMKHTKNKKYIISAASILLATLLGFTSPVGAKIRNYIFNIKNPGVENAMNHNYVQTIFNKKFSNNNLKIELTNLLMDTSNIALDFDIETNDSIKLPNNLDLWVDMSIYDDKNKVIEKEGVIDCISSIDHSITRDFNNKHKMHFSALLSSPECSIPKTSALKIKINHLNFMDKAKEIPLVHKEILNWSFNVKLEDKFINHSNIKYKVVESNPNIKILNATAIPTGINIKFDYLKPHDERLLNSSKLVDNKNHEYTSSICSQQCVKNGIRSCMTFEGLNSFKNIDSFYLEVKSLDESTIDKVKLIKVK